MRVSLLAIVAIGLSVEVEPAPSGLHGLEPATMLLPGVLELTRSRAVGALSAPLSHDHVDRPPTNTTGDEVHSLVGLKLGRSIRPPHEIGPPCSENLSWYEVPRVAAVYDV